MNPEIEFREWILEEGERWDALKHAVNTGFQAYKKKRDQQKQKTEKKKLLDKVMNSNGKAEEDAIDSIVRKGYTLSSNGELVKQNGHMDANGHFKKWMTETREANTDSSLQPSSYWERAQHSLLKRQGSQG